MDCSNGIWGVNPQRLKRPLCTIIVNGVNVQMLADSGSPFTQISESLWRESFPKQTLNQSCVHHIGYGEKIIDVVGEFNADFELRDSKSKGIIYVTRDEACLLGWGDQGNLGIILDPNSIQQVMLKKDFFQVQAVQASSWELLYPEVFKKELGLFKGFKHMIKLKNGAQPVVHNVRRVPLALQSGLKKELDRLCSSDVIEPIDSSDWVSPVVLAKKANGNLRMCVDLRDLNKNIWIDQHPLPNITQMTSTLKGAKLFSLLDMSSAYHQIELHTESRHLTAFITPEGLFQFKFMPFGLASVSDVFQRVVESMFKGMPGVMAFEDDVLVYREDQSQHNNRLCQVLSLLKQKGVTLGIDKCKLNTTTVDWLGYMLSSDGVQPKHSLVKAIEDFTIPNDKDQLRSFLGLIEFYSCFIPNCASKTYNIRCLLKKNICFC